MRLISLTANQPTFHPIHFNERGLSLIVGQREPNHTGKKGDTYNGVGKSLVVALIHFCLGSNTNKTFEQKLPGWSFTLEFKLNGLRHTVTRSTERQAILELNGKQIKLSEFKDFLLKETFPEATGQPHLSFRSLLPCFIRQGSAAYKDYVLRLSNEPPFQRLLRYGFLLGLDTQLIHEKYRLKQELDLTAKAQKNLENDIILKDYFHGANAEIQLRDLEDKCRSLEADLKRFKVAENYGEVKQQADELSKKINDLRNQRIILQNQLEAIERSLQVKADVPPERLRLIYDQAKVAMPGNVVKTLDDVYQFNKSLLEMRRVRLGKERAALNEQLQRKERDISAAGKERDGKLQFLNAHGALDEFVKLNAQLSDLRSKADKLKKGIELKAGYSTKIQQLKADISQSHVQASNYLHQEKSLIDRNMDQFRELSTRFYPDKPGGLTISNNDKENQLRFDIKAHIQDDASDGIGEVKIFCFDMTVLLLHHRHSIRFLFHDSRLYSDIDPKMRAELFRTAYEFSNTRGFQYIASVNQDQIEAMRGEMPEQEFNTLFNTSSHIVLRLTDKSPAEKLLGLEIDMDYEDQKGESSDRE